MSHLYDTDLNLTQKSAFGGFFKAAQHQLNNHDTIFSNTTATGDIVAKKEGDENLMRQKNKQKKTSYKIGNTIFLLERCVLS